MNRFHLMTTSRRTHVTEIHFVIRFYLGIVVLCIFMSPFKYLAIKLRDYEILVLPSSESSSAPSSSLYTTSSLTVFTLTSALRTSVTSIAFSSGLIPSERRKISRRKVAFYFEWFHYYSDRFHYKYTDSSDIVSQKKSMRMLKFVYKRCMNVSSQY